MKAYKKNINNFKEDEQCLYYIRASKESPALIYYSCIILPVCTNHYWILFVWFVKESYIIVFDAQNDDTPVNPLKMSFKNEFYIVLY